MENQWLTPRSVTAEQAEELQRAFVLKVYGWMAAGLMLTGIVALFTIQIPALLEILFSSRFVFLGLFVVQLGLVVWLSARVEDVGQHRDAGIPGILRAHRGHAVGHLSRVHC